MYISDINFYLVPNMWGDRLLLRKNQQAAITFNFNASGAEVII
jgi:hypothetical protein